MDLTFFTAVLIGAASIFAFWCIWVGLREVTRRAVVWILDDYDCSEPGLMLVATCSIGGCAVLGAVVAEVFKAAFP